MAETMRELTGYADRLTVSPGERIQFMVTSEFRQYDAAIVRLIHGDESPSSPGFKEEELDTDVTGTYTGRVQATSPGSFVYVAPDDGLASLRSLTLQAWVQPTTPTLGHVQGLVGAWQDNRGFGLVLDEQGALALRVGGDRIERLSTGVPLRAHQWYFVVGSFDSATSAVYVESCLLRDWPLSDAVATAGATWSGLVPDAVGLPLLIGAAASLADAPIWTAEGHFNGRIDSPRIFTRAMENPEIGRLRANEDAAAFVGTALLAAWDLGNQPASGRVPNTASYGLQGTAINHPTRAITGHLWDGSAYHPADAPDQYSAMHFHDDDLEDARWEASFAWSVPTDLRSGIYASRLRAEGTEDHIPFFVRPPAEAPSAQIAFLVPTNTYLAYANESALFRDDADFRGLTNIPIEASPYDLLFRKHPEFLASMYDLHRDGSGIDYSHHLRPILSMRPRHINWVSSAARHLSSDLCLVDWLEAKRFSYDIITDEVLDAEGGSLLQPYKVLITGSHPEYWTGSSLDALQSYIDNGGRLMYLGGNGFYWVMAVNPEQRHIVEIRRGYAGSRCWESHPGELHLAATGELGGLWRHRGRSPNSLVAVGFAGQGWDSKGSGYRQLPDSHDERVRFIFQGVESDEVIGDFGLVMDGAAGEEVDRFDHEKGTPLHALRLATSQGSHSEFYLICHEDQLVTMSNTHGTDNPNVRADLAFMETGGGGAVFSVGSMSWLGGLSHNEYNNNVSRITENVLRRFLE